MNIEDIFYDISKGYSKIEIDEICYLRHMTFYDKSRINKLYKKYEKEAEKLGLKRERDIVKDLIASNKWPEIKERSIKSCISDINMLQASKKNIKDRMEIDSLYDSIKELEEKYNSLLNERSMLIPNSVEDYANNSIRPYQLSMLIYKDENFKESAFTADDILYMDEEIYNSLLISYYSSVVNFSESKIEEVCIDSTFNDIFSICNNAFDLFGKPVSEMTLNQINLLKTSKIFTKILSECGEIPKEYSSIPDKVVMWFYLKRNDGVVTDAEIKTEENKIRSLFTR